MISDKEKLALVRASKDLNMTPLELIEATCQACMFAFINSDIAKVEREACAEICDDIDAEYEGEDVLATWCSQAIRARGNNAT